MKEKVPSMLVVSSLLYKIIPINSNKGIYMIAYNDNKSADKLNREIDNKPYFETLLAKSINVTTIKIDKMKHYYWKGTIFKNNGKDETKWDLVEILSDKGEFKNFDIVRNKFKVYEILTK